MNLSGFTTSEISRDFFTIFANLPPPSKWRLVRPAPPRYASAWRQISWQ